MNFDFEFLAAVLAIWVAFVLRIDFLDNFGKVVVFFGIIFLLTIQIKLAVSHRRIGFRIIAIFTALVFAIIFPFYHVYGLCQNCYNSKEMKAIEYTLPLIVFFWILAGYSNILINFISNRETRLFEEPIPSQAEF